MLLAPLCVAGRRSLVEFGVLVTEHEPDVVGVTVLLTDQKMLLAILDRETARLDIECRAVCGQTKVRCVFDARSGQTYVI